MERTITGRADDLGDQMKDLEMQEAGRRALPRIPLIARLDGRAFHTFTRGMNRPYDIAMMAAMEWTTKDLVSEFKPIVGYTQSDEITLVFLDPSTLFSGRYQKLTSVLAGMASAVFARIAVVNLNNGLPGWSAKLPCFDCRAWQVPDLDSALDALIWREDDAVKNSVAMLAQAHFSHKELHCKDRHEMLDMLHAKGINWNAQPTHFKRGIYVKSTYKMRVLTEEERARIPEKHRPPANWAAPRGSIEVLDFPPIRSLERDNAKNILFSKPALEPI